MAFIRPDTYIKLLFGCELSNDYKHTYLFENKESQTSFFTNHTGRRFEKNNYVNYSDNVIRLGTGETLGDGLLTANYLVFQNTNFGYNKYFYAFITSSKRISNVCIEYTYQIDVIQTWWFDIELPSCYVLREHVVNDNIGHNIVEEGLETGEYVVSSEQMLRLDENGLCYVLIATETFTTNQDGSRTWTKSGTLIENKLPVPFGYMFAFSPNKFFDDVLRPYYYDNKVDSIVTIITSKNYNESTSTHIESVKVNNPKPTYNFTVKNNKLFTAPYTHIEVDNGYGSSAKYSPQLFDDIESVFFDLITSYTTETQSMLVPKNYRGMEKDFSSGIVFDNYPVLPYNKDVYSTWIAQNKNQVNVGISNRINALGFDTLSAGFMGWSTSDPKRLTGAVGSLVDTVGYVRSVNAKIKDLKSFPPQANTHITCEPINIAQEVNRFGFSVKTYKLTDEYAQVIDDYFSMFGYQINKLKKINIANPVNTIPVVNATFYGIRPYWNFIKTNGAIIHPKIGATTETLFNSIPTDHEKYIGEILDNGITFWNQTANRTRTIGDYSKDNTWVNKNPWVDEEVTTNG